MNERITPITGRPVGAPGLARWLGGVDPDPGGGGALGVGHAALTFTPADVVSLRPDGAPAGRLLSLEVTAPPGGDDVLWVCLGAEYAHARAWPLRAGERRTLNLHLQSIAAFGLRATAADGTNAPSAPIRAEVFIEYDRRTN